MSTLRLRSFVLVAFAAGCGPSVTASDDTGDTIDAADPDASGPRIDATPPCLPPPTLAGPDVEIAPQYAGLYTAYDLGTVPGVPNPLGGAVILAGVPDTLLIAGGSESASGAIYTIGLERNACGHIVGFAGTAQQIAATPYVDANLVQANAALMVYTEWPQFTFSQLRGGGTMPARRTDLRTVGMLTDADSGPGGLGFVPPGLAAEGQLRMVTWPAGRWYHVELAPDGDLFNVTAVSTPVTIPNNPGGFAYVPAGSPGFDAQSIIVAEWVAGDPSLDRVAVYDADQNGDPMTATRREFFTKFPRPWGAYFEPVTGDYLFLSWGTGQDHVYLVQGFVPPPDVD